MLEKSKIAKTSKRGFTLIELLIVIAIIGILASALLVSLGGARSSARDARRIADLRSVQSALELYFNACGAYPVSSNACDSTIPQQDGSIGWGALTTAVTSANIGVTKLPNDPDGVNNYAYGFEGGAQRYVLRAILENYNPALDNDIDGGTYFKVNCNDTNFHYCVGI